MVGGQHDDVIISVPVSPVWLLLIVQGEFVGRYYSKILQRVAKTLWFGLYGHFLLNTSCAVGEFFSYSPAWILIKVKVGFKSTAALIGQSQ